MLILSKSVFLMIPRTGTTWARQAIRNAGVLYKEWGAKHSVAPWRPDNHGGTPPFKFTFIREPEAWVRSRWALGPWEDELKTFWSPVFEEFAAKVTAPMVEMYNQKYVGPCNFVGKAESLADDLVTALTQAGEKFNERDLRATPRINESGGNLIEGAFYDMTEDQWCRLPAEEIVRMPTELLAKLPDLALAKLPPEQLVAMTRRLAKEARPARPTTIPIRVAS